MYCLHIISTLGQSIAHRQMLIFSQGSYPIHSKTHNVTTFSAPYQWIRMHYVLTLFILNCVGTFFLVHGNIHSEIADEIQRHISPILAKYSELETINLENQRKIVELQNEVLILKQENDFKTSDLLEVTQQLQKLSQAKLAPNHLSGDICQYVDEQCPRKSREGTCHLHFLLFFKFLLCVIHVHAWFLLLFLANSL